ncbi:reverse transcriptase domain-containing protein, partial [Tanacetum coccineum]
METQYGKFLDMIRVVRINVPLVDVLAGMPNYDKFLKELVSNKHKLEQISSAFLSDESFAMNQNKVPPKLRDPGTENMLVEVGKFTFPVDFVILKMEEDSKVPLILGRPFLHTADVVIRVKQKQLNLGVGTKRMTFSIDSAMKHSYSNDDTCFSIDVIDEILEEDFDALLDEGSEILHSIEGIIIEEKLFAEFNEFMAMNIEEDIESETEEPLIENFTFNTDYKIKTYLEEPPSDLELKPLPDHLEYVFLEEPSFLSVIISSQLSDDKGLPTFGIRAHYESEKEAIHLILTGIGDEIYSTVDACQTAQEMWEAIERLQQGESLNIQDVKTNLFWEFGQFTSHDGETIESYYTRFYKMMNEMIRNNLTVATMQVNVQFLQQLQPEWSRFV